MFRAYSETGPALFNDESGAKIVGKFVLENVSVAVANTLRRCILTETRSVGFRADLTNMSDPGVRITKNTSVIFNEMLAHRVSLLPVAVRDIDGFDVAKYEFRLTVKNEKRGPITEENLVYVRAGDIDVYEKQEDGTFAAMPALVSKTLFPADPITKETALLTILRPQWNTDSQPEELELVTYPVVGVGRDHMGFSPVSQCSYEYTRDEDPVRQDQFFSEWLAAFKKITDTGALPRDVVDGYRREWETMAIQRCFKVNERGEPSSFSFTVESVGVRPVADIVAEGLRAVVRMVEPYIDVDTPMDMLGISTQPVDGRMNGVEFVFDGQEHTFGNILQNVITEMYLDKDDGSAPINYVGYKVKHPLFRNVTLRFGFPKEFKGDQVAVARQIVADAAAEVKVLFERLAGGWAALAGGVAPVEVTAAPAAI